jgi:hypothetical protein
VLAPGRLMGASNCHSRTLSLITTVTAQKSAGTEAAGAGRGLTNQAIAQSAPSSSINRGANQTCVKPEQCNSSPSCPPFPSSSRSLSSAQTRCTSLRLNAPHASARAPAVTVEYALYVAEFLWGGCVSTNEPSSRQENWICSVVRRRAEGAL